MWKTLAGRLVGKDRFTTCWLFNQDACHIREQHQFQTAVRIQVHQRRMKAFERMHETNCSAIKNGFRTSRESAELLMISGEGDSLV